MNYIAEISSKLQMGEDTVVAELTRQALGQNLSPEDILENGLIAGMSIVGKKFKSHEIFLPDVLLAARAMYAGLDLLKPHFLESGIPLRGKVVIGTVQGDLHDIGKNLVGIMLKGSGFDVIDLGHDVPAEKFIDTAVENEASVIGLSTLLTTTMPIMRQVADLLKERGLKDKITLLVGGAPVSNDFAREIGADAYGFDAIKAVELVEQSFQE